MKKLIPLLFLFGCVEGNVETKSTHYTIDGVSAVKIFTIDSCEYIRVGSSWGSHKGNCKFCIERNKCK